MADSYTKFSFAVPLATDEERDWARRAVEYILDSQINALSEDDEFYELVPDSGYVGFCAEVDKDGLWIYEEESGEPSHVVPLLQAFFQRFGGSVGFEWADTCSKPRVDGFGGGACFVTATEVRWMAGGTWLAEQSDPGSASTAVTNVLSTLSEWAIDGPQNHFTCAEAEVFARMMRAHDLRDEAEAFLDGHAEADEDEDDLHHDRNRS